MTAYYDIIIVYHKTKEGWEMKRIFLVLNLMLFSLFLVGCGPSEKTFTGVGISVTLDDSFIEKDVIQAPFYLESTKYIFTGMRESKASLATVNVYTLDDYIETVLSVNGKGSVTPEVKRDEDDNILYYYAYYHNSVEDMNFGYMMIAMEDDSNFYTMNFGCLEEEFDDNKDQFFEWASSIEVGVEVSEKE